MNLCGTRSEDLYLTSSFSGYTNVSSAHEIIENPETGNNTTHPESTPPPPIIVKLQNPTNSVIEGENILCPAGICRLNLSLEDSFSGVSASDFFCEITYGGEIVTKCNPSTLYLTGT